MGDAGRPMCWRVWQTRRRVERGEYIEEVHNDRRGWPVEEMAEKAKHDGADQVTWEFRATGGYFQAVLVGGMDGRVGIIAQTRKRHDSDIWRRRRSTDGKCS